MQTQNWFLRLLLLVATCIVWGTSFAQDSNCSLSFDTNPQYSALFDGKTLRPGSWFKRPESDTVIVMVHGIFSDNKQAWLDPGPACKFWPQIISNDAVFSRSGIYLASYFTSVDSRGYDIKNAADELFTVLRTPLDNDILAPLHFPKIVFIAHSTGGLVLKRMLTQHWSVFKDKAVGVVLIASPAKGSGWAARLDSINYVFKNKMANELRPDDPVLKDIHTDFLALVRRPDVRNLYGVELFENTFFKEDCTLWVLLCKTLPIILPPIVSDDDQGGYFGNGEIIGGTDHSSIIKPINTSASIHIRLRAFFTNFVNHQPAVDLAPPEAIEFIGRQDVYSWVKVGKDDYVLRIVASQVDCPQSAVDPLKVICRASLEQVSAQSVPSAGDRRWVPVSPAQIHTLAGSSSGYEFREVSDSSPTGSGSQSVAVEVTASTLVTDTVKTYERSYHLQEYGVSSAAPWSETLDACRTINCTIEAKIPKLVQLTLMNENLVNGNFSTPWSMETTTSGSGSMRVIENRIKDGQRVLKLKSIIPPINEH